jgi:hypothetical protein
VTSRLGTGKTIIFFYSVRPSVHRRRSRELKLYLKESVGTEAVPVGILCQCQGADDQECWAGPCYLQSTE